MPTDEKGEEPEHAEQEHDHQGEIVTGSRPTDQALAHRTEFRRVRSLPREHGGAVPAALVTATPLEDHWTRARGAGFTEVMRKPVDIDAFCSLVAALAEQGRNHQQQRRSA
jgi:DNA-binding response OmpR family regulator